MHVTINKTKALMEYETEVWKEEGEWQNEVIILFLK